MTKQAAKGFLVCVASPDHAINRISGSAYSEAVRTIGLLRKVAEVVELAATNSRAARSEWNSAGLEACDILPVRRREIGVCLSELMSRGYEGRNTLLIGFGQDALIAAHQTDSFFFPMLPGSENQCWRALAEEGLPKLLHGTFGGVYQQQLIARHNSVLKTEKTDKGE